MFLGTYQLGFSGKNRVVLPKKIRQALLGSGIVLTKGLDGCIWGFGNEDFEREAEKQLEIPIRTDEGRVLRRMFFSEAEAVELDKQGRFVIPRPLLAFAKIGKEVLLLGAGDHFEIWNPQILASL